jgi:hypothetical protein
MAMAMLCWHQASLARRVCVDDLLVVDAPPGLLIVLTVLFRRLLNCGCCRCLRRPLADARVHAVLTPHQESADTTEIPVAKNEDFSNKVHNIFFAICMPLCLFLQFGFAFASQNQQDDNDMTTTMSMASSAAVSWSTDNCNIGLFVVTVWLYRWSCMDSCITNWVLLLLPEIMTNIVLVILVFGNIDSAFDALLVGILLMSLLAFVDTLHCLICRRHQDDDKNNVEGEDGEDEEEESDYFSLDKHVDIRLV